MNRRRFLSLLALGAPATVVAEKVGLIEKVRTYFFAPPGGWVKAQILAGHNYFHEPMIAHSYLSALDPGFQNPTVVWFYYDEARQSIKFVRENRYIPPEYKARITARISS